jgi:iron complex outermembrane receptor protein
MPMKPFFLVPTLALLASAPLMAADVTPAPTGPVPASPTPRPESSDHLVVPGTINQGYLTNDVQSATRTMTPIIDTPFSIQTVPTQVIEDQGDVRLKDVERNVSGVLPSKTEGNGIQFETEYIRGFSQLTYVDGVQFYTMPTIDLVGVERIDVVKGPASAMYGGMEPGGLINIIPKLPEFTEHTTVSGEVGSYEFNRAEFDTTGPIGKDLAFRLEGAFQDNASYRDFLHQHSEFIAPSLAWNPEPGTRITTWLWFQNLDRPQDQGVVFNFHGQPVGGIQNNLAGPYNDNDQHIDDMVYNLQAEQDLAPDLKVRIKYLAHYFHGYEDAIRWNSVTATNTIAPYFDGSRFNDWQNDLIADANYQVATGPIKHDVLLGVELNRNDYHYNRRTDTALPAIKIYFPVYPTGPFPLTPGVAEQHTLSDDAGEYLQDQMGAFDDRLHLLVGGRVDNVEQKYVSFANGNHYQQSNLGFSDRIGLSYDATSWMSPYANAARSFNVNSAGSNLTYTGATLPPTTGLQYEAGIKFTTLDKRLLVTTDVYQITKQNVPVADPNHTGFSLDAGEMRSRGFECDANGQILPGLQLIASYAYTDTHVLDSTTLPIGVSFLNIPENSGSLWMSYNVQQGPLRDFGFGMGVFAEDKKAGDSPNSFYLPGYARVDAGAWYDIALSSGAKMKLQLNIDNLFNKTYYESSASAGSVEPGSPFTVMGKCSITF